MFATLFILLFGFGVIADSGIAPNEKPERHQNPSTKDSNVPAILDTAKSHNPKDTGREKTATQTEYGQPPAPDYTIYLVLFTGVLAGVSIWQAIISRGSAKKQLRAYIGIQTVAPQGKTERLRFEIKNFGQTPALNVYCWCAPNLVFPEGIDLQMALPPYGQTERAFAVIEPGARLHFAILKEDITSEQNAAMIHGKVFFYGRIGYWDVFGKKHWRTFCFHTYAQPSDKEGKIWVTFPYYEFGNESDDSRRYNNKKYVCLRERATTSICASLTVAFLGQIRHSCFKKRCSKFSLLCCSFINI